MLKDSTQAKRASIRYDLIVPDIDATWPISGLLVQYLRSCIDRGLSQYSVKAYRIDLTQFIASSISKDIPTKADLTAYKALISSVSPASRKRKLMSLSAFCTWLEEEGITCTSIFKKFDFRVRLPRRLPRNLSVSDVENLLEAIKNNDKGLLIVRLLLFTGLRISEFCALSVGDFDHNNNTFRVTGKGNKQRIVPLSDESTLDRLNRYLRKRGGDYCDPLFLNRLGGPLTSQSVRALLRRYAPKVTPHMLRHTCATLHCEAGMNVRHVQRMLGHSSLSITEQYIHVSEEILAAAIKSHPLRISSAQPAKEEYQRIQESPVIKELYKNPRYKAYLVRRGVEDPESVLQEAAIKFAKSPPPPEVELSAAIFVQIKQVSSSLHTRSKTQKRGSGRVFSIEDIAEYEKRRIT